MLTYFLKGLILGIAISMPVGPVSILCIQRTLFYGVRIGLITTVGSALADGVYASIAAFGLTVVATFLTGYQLWIHIIGGIFLFYLGITILKSPTKNLQLNQVKVITIPQAFISAFFITITNPITIFSFIAIFAGAGLAVSGSFENAIFLVLGLICGSISWEFILSLTVKLILQQRLNSKMMRFINYISGSTILVFALLSFRIV